MHGLRGLLRWLKFLVVCVGLGMRGEAAGGRPNIVLILADDLGVHYHAPKTAPASAVQVWPWKLVEHLEDGRVELFDLGKDPGEAKDLSGLEAGRVAGMRGQLERWRVEVGAAMPTLNPAFKGGAGAE